MSSTNLFYEFAFREMLVPSPLCHAYPSIDHLNKKNAEIKQVLKQNGYQESIISIPFKGITNSTSLLQ